MRPWVRRSGGRRGRLSVGVYLSSQFVSSMASHACVLQRPRLSTASFRFGFRAFGRRFLPGRRGLPLRLPEPKSSACWIIDDAEPTILSGHHDFAVNRGAKAPGLLGQAADVISYEVGNPEGLSL